MPDVLYSSLLFIIKKVRRLTRNPSESQLSSVSITGYIDNFILYDMPAYVKLDSLKDVFTFYTIPNQYEYETSIGITHINDTFYHFKDYYTNVSAPVYVGGEEAAFTQSFTEFYDNYSKKEQQIKIATGDGATTAFTGTIDNVPMLSSFVYVSAESTTGSRLLIKDDGEGAFTGNVSGANTINYITGAYSIKFSSAPKNATSIWFSFVPYTAAKPDTILFFNDKLTLRPVPDKVYKINLTVRKRPSELLLPQQMPELSEWWEFVALGAAIKLLHDRLDFDTIDLLMPEFKRQEILINRRKIVQNSGKRAQTIFSSSVERGS